MSQDGYKYIPVHPRPAIVPWGTEIETGFKNEDQLFYLPNDPKEKVNLEERNPNKLAVLKAKLKKKIER